MPENQAQISKQLKELSIASDAAVQRGESVGKKRDLGTAGVDNDVL